MAIMSKKLDKKLENKMINYFLIHITFPTI